MGSGLHAVELVYLALLGFVVLFAGVARKLDTPYPIVLVVAGLVLSFIPGTPRVSIDPNFVFLVILPPLLFASAWRTSWRDFRYNLFSISMLAFGLVAFTVLGVAALAHFAIPAIDWKVGLVLGAVVAPTDAIAATSIARRLGLPRRVVDILEGESLLNDASGLLALEFAIGLLVSGEAPGIGDEVWRFIALTIGGIVVGLVVGFLIDRVERLVNDAPIEITLSLLVPYAAYLAAESIHVSGVLAVVTCGLYLSRRSATFFAANVRLQAESVWQSLEFILNGVVFILIGLQLPKIVSAIHGYSISTLVLFGLGFSAALIVLRMVWTFPGTAFAYFVRNHFLGQPDKLPGPKMIFIVGWTGMRGVVSLAAAQSIPLTLGDGSPLPHRDLIIFLTFSVILVTLVLQGLTLSPLVRALGLSGAAGPDCEEKEARRILIDAGLRYLEESQAQDVNELAPVYQDLLQHYHQRLKEVEDPEAQGILESASSFRRLNVELLRVERRTAVRLRDEGRISDDVLRKLQYELDLNEARLQLQ